MSHWWKRFKPNQSTLPAALIATAICGVALLVIWTPPRSPEADIDRYGEALSQTLGHANAGLMLNQDRIALAVIANEVANFDEVAGVVFYSAGNEIVALSGSTDPDSHFTAQATMDDTIAGYVTVVLNKAAFAPPARPWDWLLSIAVLIGAPFVSLGILQLSARGNRSLPIVSVPEPAPPAMQSSFVLGINLYNQLGLSRAQREQAVEDALTMAREVCAIHHGFALPIDDKGVLMLFDRGMVDAGQAVCASFLMLTLLEEFETEGAFRCHLSETECPGAPGELTDLPLEAIEETTDINRLMMLAALARPSTLLVEEIVCEHLEADERAWTEAYDHPLLVDLDAEGQTYWIAALPERQSQLIESQATVILGFNQASA